MKRGSLVDRFWSKFDRPEHGCWEWRAALHEHGYGIMGKGPRSAGLIRAHRVSWLLFNGPIPDDLEVLHHCDNPKCVRPDHLFLGTQKDNIHDCISKGRNYPPPHNEGLKQNVN